MKTKATFYHAGCPVCLDTEPLITDTIDRNRYGVEVVHLGEDKNRVADAEIDGVKSVPALMLNGHVYHINYGASIDDLK